MSLRVIDGYDWGLSSANAAAGLSLLQASSYYPPHWDSASTFANTGRFGTGQCLTFVTSGFSASNQNLIKPIGPHITGKGFLGVAIKFQWTSSCKAWLSFYDTTGNADQFSVLLDALGVIRVYKGRPDTGTLLASSDTGSFQEQKWFYLEIGGLVATSGGYIEVRVNTKTLINLPSVNNQTTSTAGFDAFTVYGQINTLNFVLDLSVDDLYLCDDQGSINNTFLGNVRVFTQLTAGASVTNFSKFGAQPTNWQTVQNKALDDTQYVYDPNNGDYDLYQMQAIVTGPTVHGVQVRGGYRQDDATQVTARNVLKSGATQVEGSDHLTNQTYTYYTDIWELDPNTGVGWTGTNVNLILAGPKKQA